MSKDLAKSTTSNTTKLLKHLDKLQLLQDGYPSPVMVHVALTNKCNLKCDYCCYANRTQGDELDKEQVKNVLDAFRARGTHAVEWTGGGDPTLHPDLNELTVYAKNSGYSIGLITNAINFGNFEAYKDLDWMRISMHGLNKGKDLYTSIMNVKDKAPDLDLSGTYIWTHGSEGVLNQVVYLAEEFGIPTRITPDLTLGEKSINEMMGYVNSRIEKEYEESGVDGLERMCFLSDFNVKTERRNNNCYMHLVKPFVYTDGNVYVCPSAALSPENTLNVNEKFKVCDIGEIQEQYIQGVKKRVHDCEFCKYSQANELLEDILTETKHNDFA